MNIGAILATSLFVGGALFLFVPALWDNWSSGYRRKRFRLYIGPRLDYVAVVSSIVGVFIISLALGLTLFQGVLVWNGLWVYQIKGNYK